MTDINADVKFLATLATNILVAEPNLTALGAVELASTIIQRSAEEVERVKKLSIGHGNKVFAVTSQG